MSTAKRLTDEQQERAIVMAVGSKVDAKVRKRLCDDDGFVMHALRRRAWKRYLADGGDPTNWRAFLDWPMKNLPAIIAIIASLLA